jgi:cysteine-rich repeat protein
MHILDNRPKKDEISMKLQRSSVGGPDATSGGRWLIAMALRIAVLSAVGGCMAPPTVTPSQCGDGIHDEIAGEECDDGNRLPGDGCNESCWIERCGNGKVDVGEACDAGGVDTAGCDHDCTLPACGDSIFNVEAEACDAGGKNTAGCDSDCTAPVCGDFVFNAAAGEACDTGGEDTAACDSDCTLPECGDFEVNPAVGEACDEGGEDTATCDGDCTAPACGDAWVNEAKGEACDDGGDTAACDRDCTAVVCGDDLINTEAGEECDSSVDTTVCDADCTAPRCGDGYINATVGEVCDDGNAFAGDGCSADCRSLEICGNSIVDIGEACDDGGESARCNVDCTLAGCGDRVVNAMRGETCDEGGVDTAGCDRDCTAPVCGDFVINTAASEACDQGGVSTAACDSDCTLPVCGDSMVNLAVGESCDEGGVNTGTCDVDCTAPACGDALANEEAGEACDEGGDTASCDRDCTPAACGDGQVNPVRGESCDDANTLSGDGCSATCRLEHCGNGAVDPGEACDDGNHVSGDGCSADCRSTEICGNGVVDMSEACDDGGESIRCNADCTEARCSDRVVNGAAGETCDEGGVDTAACDRDCTAPACGDFVINTAASEACDTGGVSTAACDIDCTQPVCGDSVVNPAVGESCDQGGVNTGTCDGDCTAPACGDGWVNDERGEACDEGGDTAACDRDCTAVVCGDDLINTEAGEECDSSVDTGVCDADCTAPRCGDGHINATLGEVCDDGNAFAGDGCSADCRSLEICGNDIVDVGEACDDGGESARCNVDCTLAGCGDWMVNATRGEACDEGGANTAACDGDCTAPACGDAWVNQERGEACDERGDTASCDRDCTAAACGDGLVNILAGEQCDDSGESDQCDHDCTLALCGDGEVNALAGEACDEGGVDTASCNMNCTVPACGDGHVNLAAGEDCESGGDSLFCDGDCTFAWCGDGTVNPVAGEDCDDGNADDDDGCLTSCEGGTCEDGIQNGDEEGVDCGGSCGPCGEAQAMVVAGAEHTCALLETGAVRCWGQGAYGRLGYGNTITIGDDETPATAGDVDVGGDVVQLVAGAEHTCALLDTGAVRCWGQGAYGQLGYGNTNPIGDDETPATAGDVDVGGSVVQLAAGGFHTCALLDTGAVRCWGHGGNGQLGYGYMGYIGDDETPATAGDVDVGGSVVQLAAGGFHTCALLETGAVRCWGYDAQGQLGYGHTNHIGDDEAPASAGDVNVGGSVVQLVAGTLHTCALLETGAVRCWGSGLAGQLGYGNTNFIGDDEAPATAGDVNVGGSAVQLAAGGEHTCALLETGAVRCWGYGDFGQLGYGNTNRIGDNETPASAGDVNVGGLVVQLAAGGAHTCALLETAAVRCWGNGAFGRLGYGNTNNIGDNETPASAGDVNVGVPVDTPGGLLVVAGWYHTCALLETGVVRCWGFGGSGQLGYGSQLSIGDDEAPTTAGDVNVGGRVVQLAAGAYHTCALLETGAVRCWGEGQSGGLGYGNINDVGDTEAPATAGDVNVSGRTVQLAAGANHTCALLDTGAVRCWGAGESGQLGYGNTENIGDDEVPATARDVNVGGRVIRLVAGGAHTCALLEAGAVRCWGEGSSGQLGYGNTENIGDDEAPAAAGNVSVGGRVLTLAAAEAHTCALLKTGAVRCWGDGSYGQLGHGNTNHIGDDEAPATAGDVSVGGVAVRLAAGAHHTCAVLTPGTVRCWGAGESGRLGYGNTNRIGDDETPATAGDVGVGGRVVRLAAGEAHTCALLDRGAVRCWGEGASGRLGYGNTNDIGDDESPVVAGDVNVGNGVVQVAAGGEHTCALMDTGPVRCWGNGLAGRLGYGNTNDIGDNETPASAGDVPYR